MVYFPAPDGTLGGGVVHLLSTATHFASIRNLNRF
jgi:hypothetical protein